LILDIVIYILILPIFKQEALRCKNRCFCYWYTESLFFVWIWLDFICYEFLRKIPFRKMG